jgi:hypothetical protein
MYAFQMSAFVVSHKDINSQLPKAHDVGPLLKEGRQTLERHIIQHS